MKRFTKAQREEFKQEQQKRANNLLAVRGWLWNRHLQNQSELETFRSAPKKPAK